MNIYIYIYIYKTIYIYIYIYIYTSVCHSVYPSACKSVFWLSEYSAVWQRYYGSQLRASPFSKVIPVGARDQITRLQRRFRGRRGGRLLGAEKFCTSQAPITGQSLSLCQSDKCNQAAGVKQRRSNLIRVITIK